MAKKSTIEIPGNLYEKLEARITGTDFSSVSDYVVFVLGELLLAEESEGKAGLSAEDEGKVKERLRALGYID